MCRAAYHVSKLLIAGVPGAQRCALIFEGFEIDYAHAKLIPIVGDHTVEHLETDHAPVYKGYVSSKAGVHIPDDEIQSLAKKCAFCVDE